MGYGQFSNRYYKPYNKGQMLATMRAIEGRDGIREQVKRYAEYYKAPCAEPLLVEFS